MAMAAFFRRVLEARRPQLRIVRIVSSKVSAVSSTVDDIREISTARREAERILRVLASGRVAKDVASIEDVQTNVTLLILQDAVARNPDLVRGPVEEIAKHDREKGSVYLETLREYLAAFGDVPTAAGRALRPALERLGQVGPRRTERRRGRPRGRARPARACCRFARD